MFSTVCLNRSRAVLSRAAILKSPPARFMSVINLSNEEAVDKFSKINDKSILYFTATWCPPCKAIKPIYEQMSDKHTDVAFGKVDVDDNPESAAKHQISGVPTFIIFKGEEVYNRFTGADPNMLEQTISDLKNA